MTVQNILNEMKSEAPRRFHERLWELLAARFAIDPLLEEPVRYLLAVPGKGLRPALAFAVAEACGGDPAAPGVEAVAAAGELLHVASLIHDDIVDGAERRRGLSALHRAFDPVTAVLTGDYLMGAAYAILSADASVETLRRLGPAVHALAEAELAEIRARGRELAPAEAERIAIGKTGALFGWISAAAAIECHEWMGENAWDEWGKALGLAFQIADDLGDRLAVDEGKDVGLDLETETPTVVAAYLARPDGAAALRRRVHELLHVIERPPARGADLDVLVDLFGERLVARTEAFLVQVDEL